MNNIMFKSSPILGDLYLEEVLFSYENNPIVFTCKNKDNVRSFCLCNDSIIEQTWMIKEITNNTLLKVLYDEISICKAFELGDSKVVIAIKEGSDIKYKCKQFNEIDIMELPDPNEKLEMKDELSSFISKIEVEINYHFYFNKSSLTESLLFNNSFFEEYLKLYLNKSEKMSTYMLKMKSKGRSEEKIKDKFQQNYLNQTSQLIELITFGDNVIEDFNSYIDIELPDEQKLVLENKNTNNSENEMTKNSKISIAA